MTSNNVRKVASAEPKEFARTYCHSIRSTVEQPDAMVGADHDGWLATFANRSAQPVDIHSLKC